MHRFKLAVLLAALALLGLLPRSSSGVAEGKAVSLRQLMTPAKFRETGLTKLTPTELLALEEWLGTYTEVVTEFVRSSNAKSPSPAPQPPQPTARTTPSSQIIETCIEDDFEGWEGETIFKLCNGQIWQQTEYAYTYHYVYRPDVVIYRTSSGYRMKVDGVPETIGVERIK